MLYMLGERLLDAINQGKITISIDGKPIVSLDTSAKSLELEMSGLEKIDLKISNLFVTRTSRGKMFLHSSRLVKKFAKNGWNFSLYDKGERLVTAGGRSRFGPRLLFNPLKLKQILKVV